MRFCTLVRYCILCVFLLPVLAATTLFASPPVETKPKKQIRIARKLEFPFSLSTKSALAAASLKYLQARKSTQPPRPAVSAKTRKSRPRAKFSNTRPTTSQGVYHYLAQKRLTVEYIDLPFEQVMDELRDQLSINMIIYWPQIQSGQIDRDTPVTVELKNASAYTVLNAILNYVSSGSFSKLDFVVNQGVMEIGLKGRLVERRIVRVYYVADLMQQRSDYFDSVLGIGLGGQSGGGQFGSGQSGGSRSGSGSNRRNQSSDRFR